MEYLSTFFLELMDRKKCDIIEDKYHFIDTHRSEFSVNKLCRELEVSRSGYYAWKIRGISARKRREQELLHALVELHEKYPAAGLDCLYHLLKPQHHCSRNMVHRLMKKYNIHSIRKRTYIVGYAFSNRIDSDLTVAALRMAVRRQKPCNELIFHSDRGVQYASGKYRKVLVQCGIKQSMSRKCDPYDNAVAENFFSCLKCEPVHHKHYCSRDETAKDIFAYIENFWCLFFRE